MSQFANIPYQGFCWVVGTTSFRTAQLNLKIEQQLLMIDSLYKHKLSIGSSWHWNPELQADYYDLMKANDFVTGQAPRPAKDAREKTSGLVDIGLLTKDRRITPAGEALVHITKATNDSDENLFKIKDSNPFRIEADSYIYFRQLLKTTIYVDSKPVRPYIVLAKLLTELKYLSFDEFKYLLPICSSPESTQNIVNKIKLFRQSGKTDINSVIHDTLMLLSSYKDAYKLFMNCDTITEDLICTIGMNRKSRLYDKPYFKLFTAIYNYFVLQSITAVELYDVVTSVKQARAWREILFTTSSRNEINRRTKDGTEATIINNNSGFTTLAGSNTSLELKNVFFKHLHVSKAKATLEDYFDLNRRYFSITDTIIFSDDAVQFDLIPKNFFKLVINDFYSEAYVPSFKKELNIKLAEIHPALVFNSTEIYKLINMELGVDITHIDQSVDIVTTERLNRLHSLIDNHFTKDVLLELLHCFEVRNDRRIEELITKEATAPTMFEYILGIIWYEISDRKGNILDFMNLSLDANLLPKTHAGGGEADIVYEYEETAHYPKHSLLIEATLSDSTGQRRMELEPVSRHLGNYLLKHKSDMHYCVFIAPFVHINVLADFRTRKTAPYYSSKGDDMINGMKIIPIPTLSIQHILETGKNYNVLYKLFDEQHNSDSAPKQWGEEIMQKLQDVI